MSTVDKIIREAGGTPSVDTTKQVLVDGEPVPQDGSHREDRGDGQQKGYVVLTPEERARGFVRPVRKKYVHLTCGTVTVMSQAIAETYARKPDFYGATFCVACGKHFPVGRAGEFVWDEDQTQKVGT